MIAREMCLFIFWIFLSFAQGEVKIWYRNQDTDMIPDSEPLRVIELTDLTLNCTSNVNRVNFTWIKSAVTLSNNSMLSITRVSIGDAGQYQCKTTYGGITNETKSLSLEIQQPPSAVVIQGRTSLLSGQTFTMTGSSSGFPEPTLEWRRDATNGTLLARGNTYTFTPSSDFELYCIATNRMAPTFEDYQLGFACQMADIKLQHRATILRIDPQTYVVLQEGDPLNLTCETSGYPDVELWWEKEGDPSFSLRKPQYSVHSADKSNSGKYICYAKNTVYNATGQPDTTQVSDFVIVSVGDKFTSTTQATCSCSTDVYPACNMTTPVSTVIVTESIYGKPAFIGLLTAFSLVAVALVVSICCNVVLVRRRFFPENPNERRTSTSETVVKRVSSQTRTTTAALPVNQYTALLNHYTEVNDYDQLYQSVGSKNDGEVTGEVPGNQNTYVKAY